MTKLNTQQELFCQAYVDNNDNATEAYIQAGYKSANRKAAGNKGSRLVLENVGVANRIKEIKAEREAEAKDDPDILDSRECEIELTKIVRTAMQESKYGVAIKAIDTLNKMHGSYISKVEVGGVDGGPLMFSWAGGKA